MTTRQTPAPDRIEAVIAAVESAIAEIPASGGGAIEPYQQTLRNKLSRSMLAKIATVATSAALLAADQAAPAVAVPGREQIAALICDAYCDIQQFGNQCRSREAADKILALLAAPSPPAAPDAIAAARLAGWEEAREECARATDQVRYNVSLPSEVGAQASIQHHIVSAIRALKPGERP